jgi:hypothetical protein
MPAYPKHGGCPKNPNNELF